MAPAQQVSAQSVVQLEAANARCCEDDVPHAVGVLSAGSGVRLDCSASDLRRYAAASLTMGFDRCAIMILSLHFNGLLPPHCCDLSQQLGP